jgi:hypothetical protein
MACQLKRSFEIELDDSLLFRTLSQLYKRLPNETRSFLRDMFVPITLEIEHISRSPSFSV